MQNNSYSKLTVVLIVLCLSIFRDVLGDCSVIGDKRFVSLHVLVCRDWVLSYVFVSPNVWSGRGQSRKKKTVW